VIRNRRAALDGLSKILDAGAPEDLFTGPDEEALFLYDLLVDTTRARSSSYYWEICRTARRRGVTPEYVVDRALVLLAAMTERRRSDLYRILGVPPLASGEVIRQRWIEIAKRHHPDAGGDGAVFRHAKQAYEVLRDSGRRMEYERFWLRAHGPFERVTPGEDLPLLEEMRAGVVASAGKPPAVPERRAEPEPAPPPVTIAVAAPRDGVGGVFAAAERLFATKEALDQRIAQEHGGGLSALLGRLEATLGRIRREELEALAAETAREIAALETLGDQLAQVATLKRRLGA
jgi:hypothetical protein